MGSKTTEHDFCSCREFDCELCDKIAEKADYGKVAELYEKEINCQIRRREQYSHAYDKWSEENIKKMEEKFEEYKKAGAEGIQFDENLKEKEYWIKRQENEYEKAAHGDFGGKYCKALLMARYLTNVAGYFTKDKLACNCPVQSHDSSSEYSDED